MPTEKPKPTTVKEDAQALERKFGALAEVYAETRSEAAEIAGDEAAEEHWRQVAASIDDQSDR